ncbi:GntR family transcriptional regulator [Solihabitans fulvus]|uniref:GntR family transcriptional regulator n=1 Tax=Solihabitans fulvus TaxID=1892852 RepID=A0A5B2XNU9_9PSEU|nr:GntR family transcriptional regulator [Solihabitans fulvus]KAA2264815.1 GntR family transcriptional regulator [Solihabitans fulvus]
MTIALFRKIAKELRGDILANSLSPGDAIPSENDLAHRFDTTRATVRKAIALLRAEGLVISGQGARTIVRPRPRVKMLVTGANYSDRRSSGMSNFNAEASAQGQQANQRLLSVTEEAAPAEVAGRLDIATGDAVIIRRRLFTIEDEPMQLCDGYYPVDLFRSTPVAESRLIKGGVHAAMTDPAGSVRREVRQFVEDLDVRLPLPHEAETLAIPEGVPVVRVLRTAYDSDGRALEVLDSLLPADRYAFRYVIDVL